MDSEAPSRLGTRASLLPAGDAALVVQFGEEVDRAISALVTATARSIAESAPPGLVEIVPTFRSLLLHYDPRRTSQRALAEAVAALPLPEARALAPARIWTLPVTYGGEAGPDLPELAARLGMTESQAAELHEQTSYHVYMLGFLPGYAYLGDLPERLRVPRRQTPRVRVPAGAVSIANALTAVYPVESPGGWWLIGHCPVAMFDAGRSPPALLAPGDGVRFQRVEPEEARAIRAASAEGRYRPRCEAP